MTITKQIYSYSSKDTYAEIPVKEYFEKYYQPEKYREFCKVCPNYGNSWGCPPFVKDVISDLRNYKNLLLIATKVTPQNKDIPFNQSRLFLKPERERLENLLLRLEKERNGRATAYIGSCLHCPEGTCTRPKGLPCRHPQFVRPSLESYGFDVTATCKDIFGIDILWSIDGKLPEYLTLISGLFY